MADEPVRRVGRDLVFASVALGATLVLCLVASELVLRLAFPVPYESPVRLEFTQNLPGLKRHLVYEENQWGVRSLSMQALEKPEGTIRILAMGGSTTKQDTQSTADTWTGVLETRLNEALAGEGRVEVLALGRSGKTAASRVAELQPSIERFDPDILITLEGVNDLAWNGLPGYAYAGPSEFDDLAVGQAPTLLSRCRESLQLCRRLKILKDYLTLQWAKWRGLALEWHSEFLDERREGYRALPYVASPVRDPDPFVEFRDAVAAILDRALAAGLRVVVVGQPVLWKDRMSDAETAALWFWVGTPEGKVRPDPTWLAAEMRRYNAAQRALAAARGVPYVELDGRIPKDLEHFFDDCHTTDRGSRLQAELIFPEVLAQVRAVQAQRQQGS